MSVIILELTKKESRTMEQKEMRKMNRQEYTSYVQKRYRNDPQWVRTMLISKFDKEHSGK